MNIYFAVMTVHYGTEYVEPQIKPDSKAFATFDAALKHLEWLKLNSAFPKFREMYNDKQRDIKDFYCSSYISCMLIKVTAVLSIIEVKVNG